MPKIKTSRELLRGIASGLRVSVNRPNVFGYKPATSKHEEFHRSNVKIRAIFGGNRSGKTVSGAVETVMRAMGVSPFQAVPPPPVFLRVVAVDFINGVDKIVKPEISRWLPPSQLRGGSWTSAYDRDSHTLHLENESTIEFMSQDQDLDKFSGASRHGIWFDEEPPHAIWVENMARLIDTGGVAWLSMTPVEGMTWVYDDIYIASRTDPRIDVWEVDMTENPHLNPGEIESFLSGLTPDERSARQSGKFVQVGGLIYKMFRKEIIIDPFIPPKEYLHAAGMDHGFNNPTAWLWGAVDSDGRVFIYDEHYESGKIVAYHAQKVIETNRAHGIEPAYSVGDPSIRNVDPLTGTSVQLEYIEHGVPILIGNNDVHAGVNRVAKYLIGRDEENPNLYITRNCVNLLYEIQRYRWSVWATKKAQFEKNKKEEPHKKDDHACDALRYLIASRPEMDSGEEVPEPIGNIIGAPEAISDPDNYRDPGMLDYHKVPANVDPHLGSEW
jgi:phage terminase large subunit-like protein